MKLQVPENFILLAFCTHTRQNFQNAHEGRLAFMRKALPPDRASSFFQPFLACLLAISTLSCARLPRRFLFASSQTAPRVSQAGNADAPLVNINTASPVELEKLPGIGQGLAARIISHRNEYGRFRRAEHLMMVRGISARRYQAMQALITVE